jgi:hypothetical protein
MVYIQLELHSEVIRVQSTMRQETCHVWSNDIQTRSYRQTKQNNDVVTQQAVNNNSYNYPPNYSIFPEVIRDTLVSRDLGAKVVTFAYVS